MPSSGVWGQGPSGVQGQRPWSPKACFPSPSAVQVWAFRLEGDPGPLNAEEQARSQLFRDPTDAARYGVAHGVLRQILAARLGMAPEQVPLTRTPAGKPVLAGRAAETGVTFSLSHGRHHGLVALGEGVRVGVDLEDGAAPADLPGVARLVFSDRETATLLAHPPALRAAAFLTLWVRKEAVLKALGTGFLADPRAVETNADGPVWVAGARWSCLTLSDAPALRALGCRGAAAVAFEGADLGVEVTAFPVPQP